MRKVTAPEVDRTGPNAIKNASDARACLSAKWQAVDRTCSNGRTGLAGIPSLEANDMITTDPKKRKGIPVYTGFVEYFPLAIAAVAELSRVGNDQHNPGSPLKWDRSKSGDERDALMRHLLQSGTVDKDGVRHSTKVAWRAMAALQKEIELSMNDNAAIEREIEKSESPKFAYAKREEDKAKDFAAVVDRVAEQHGKYRVEEGAQNCLIYEDMHMHATIPFEKCNRAGAIAFYLTNKELK